MSIMNSLILRARCHACSGADAARSRSRRRASRPSPRHRQPRRLWSMRPQQNDTTALLKLFGPGGKDIVQSGDAADDKAARAQFAARARAKLQVEPDHDNPNRVTVVVGDQNWPLPGAVDLQEWPLVFRRRHWPRGNSGAAGGPQRTGRHRRLPRICGSANGIRVARSRCAWHAEIRAAHRQFAGQDRMDFIMKANRTPWFPSPSPMPRPSYCRRRARSPSLITAISSTS